MQKDSKISVIIPALNRPNLVKAAVRSVQANSSIIQTIVVDDGSKPRLNLGKKVLVLRNVKSEGPALSRNRGMEKISKNSDYVAFLDSDDCWHQNFASECVRVLSTDSSLVGVVALSHKVIGPGFPFLLKLKLRIFNLFKDLVLIACFIFNNGRLPRSLLYLCQISHLMFNKNKIDNVKFDKNYEYCEDWKFLLDITKKGSLAILPKKLVYYRYSANSNTFSIIKSATKDKLIYYIKLIDEMKSELGYGLGVRWFEYYAFNHLIRNI